MTDLSLLKSITDNTEKSPAPWKTERAGEHYSWIVGIGKDHTAEITMDKEAYLALQASFNPMSNLIKHAERELKLMEADGSLYGDMLPKAVMELIEVFSNQGHSGMSAPIVLQIFERLAKFKPWMPLTGDDSEWNEVSEGVYQNNRCSSVFKSKDRFDGQAYDINGKVFKDESGSHFTSKDSSVLVTFPYVPKTEYVDA